MQGKVSESGGSAGKRYQPGVQQLRSYRREAKGAVLLPELRISDRRKDEHGAKCKEARHGRLEGREGCPAEIISRALKIIRMAAWMSSGSAYVPGFYRKDRAAYS